MYFVLFVRVRCILYAYVVLLYAYVSQGIETEEKVGLFVRLYLLNLEEEETAFQGRVERTGTGSKTETGSWHQVVGA